MTKKKQSDKTIPLISSFPETIINNRFRLKISVFNNGNDESTILMVIFDLLENGFKLKFFGDDYDAANYLKLLQAA